MPHTGCSCDLAISRRNIRSVPRDSSDNASLSINSSNSVIEIVGDKYVALSVERQCAGQIELSQISRAAVAREPLLPFRPRYQARRSAQFDDNMGLVGRD